MHRGHHRAFVERHELFIGVPRHDKHQIALRGAALCHMVDRIRAELRAYVRLAKPVYPQNPR